MSKAQCLNCLAIIESKHVHDYVSCPCKHKSDILTEEFVSKLDQHMMEGSTITADLAVITFAEVVGHGFSLDGGDEYRKVAGNLQDYKPL